MSKPFDEIVNKTGVIKPSIIKWNNIYRNEIKEAKHLLTKKLAEKIAARNSDTINGIPESQLNL